MARYILIDLDSGYIFGDSADFNGGIYHGDDALEYAQALDASIGCYNRTYEMHSNGRNQSSGYHVYRADIDGSEAVTVVWDGQDQDTIDAVQASCQYVGFISTRSIKE